MAFKGTYIWLGLFYKDYFLSPSPLVLALFFFFFGGGGIIVVSWQSPNANISHKHIK